MFPNIPFLFPLSLTADFRLDHKYKPTPLHSVGELGGFLSKGSGSDHMVQSNREDTDTHTRD